MPPPDPQPPSAEELATGTRYIAHGLLPIALYGPDFPALEAAPTRLVVGGGAAFRGEFPQRTAVALAGRLGTPLAGLPRRPRRASSPIRSQFTAVLTRVLA